jgi:hypothetical protein
LPVPVPASTAMRGLPAPAFVVDVDIPEDLGHFGDHQALA